MAGPFDSSLVALSLSAGFEPGFRLGPRSIPSAQLARHDEIYAKVHHHIGGSGVVAEQKLGARLAQLALEKVQVVLHVLGHARLDGFFGLFIVAAEPLGVQDPERVEHVGALGHVYPADARPLLCGIRGDQSVGRVVLFAKISGGKRRG